MSDKAQITITWTPPYDVNVTFPENPILCAFMLKQASKIVDGHFDKPASSLTLATTLPPGPDPGR